MLEIDIPKTNYSKYAQSLNRLFKNLSLENLQHNLKNPKVFKIKESIQDQPYQKFINIEKKLNKCLYNLVLAIFE